MFRVGAGWARPIEDFREHHRHPWNRRCHLVGMPLIAASVPLAASLVGLPVAIPAFLGGWALLLAGHAIEGKPPAFVARARRRDIPFDVRNQLAGIVWWLGSVGLVALPSERDPCANE